MRMRHAPGVIAIFAFLFCSVFCEATIQLPANKGKRDQFMERLQRICRDYTLTAALDAKGNWIVTKSAKPIQLKTFKFVFDEETNSFKREDAGLQASNITPKGCKLICDLVDHAKKVTLVGDNTVLVGQTSGDKPADRNNGKGTDSTVTFQLNMTDTDIFVYDGKNNAGAYINIKAPVDIALAHELIHALHNLNGTRKAADPEGQAIDGSSTGGAGGHGITENDIREEQNRVANYRPPLLARHGHCGGLNK